MSGASAKSLLGAIRCGTQIKGLTRPNPGTVNAMKGLADKLAKLSPTEFIDVLAVAEKPLHVQYIRSKTGELLADIRMADDPPNRGHS
jgi:hypothetical protein